MFVFQTSRHALVFCFAMIVSGGAAFQTFAQGSFVAPPRTISDITAILDQQKPDPAKIAAAKANANSEPPPNSDNQSLAVFFSRRAEARRLLGNYGDARDDLIKSIDFGKGTSFDVEFAKIQLANLYRLGGDPRTAVNMILDTWEAIRVRQELALKGSVMISLINAYLSLGEPANAEQWMKRLDSLESEMKQDRNHSLISDWREAPIANGRGVMFEAQGRFSEAAQAYLKSVRDARSTYERYNRIDPRINRKPTIANVEWMRDQSMIGASRVRMRQGQLLDAESLIREAVLNCLQLRGKYSAETALALTTFANILSEQGRDAEAEKMAGAVVDIYQQIGISEDSQSVIQARSAYAQALGRLGRWSDAIVQYDAMAQATSAWPIERKSLVLNTVTRAQALLNSGKQIEGANLARTVVAELSAKFGDKHQDTAIARGVLALALAMSGQDRDADEEFQKSVGILISVSREADDENQSPTALDQIRRQIIEGYIVFLTKTRGNDPLAAADSLRLADSVRGQSVHKALAASSARAAAKDPALSNLARKEQDLEKQIAALSGALTNGLSLPPDQRDDKALRELRTQIDKMRTERASVRQEIERKFPDYAALIDPRPPGIDEIRASLRPGEAFISVYLGKSNSFVWAVPKEGNVGFTSAPIGADEVEKRVNRLREALEPKAETLEDIPAFDLAVAHELYKLLLQPVEAAWKPAKSLVLTTNGALGLLPLGLLPTAPTQVSAGAVKFEEYKSVPWLAKTHAVALVPSASALKTLRNLPVASKSRETLIGFGDPLFSTEQAKEAGVQVASAATATRGTPLKRRNAPQTSGVDSAELALLPRLPDTADELKSISLALQADPSKVLFLGKEANEKRVKSTNLSGFKIVAFATHGLVPGELNGLTQPALALSAPAVAGVDGDGLLTMEEILGLKLDADWVVLSACNTGAGSGAGAEAASGLGRAFFYAGTRALLVTNWSVHSVSAMELVTDLFARQSKGQAHRAEALREAMVALMEGPGYVEGGKSQFSYAHPLFWAPYSIIGDGGGG